MTSFSPNDALRLAFVHEAGFIPNSSSGYYCVSRVDRQAYRDVNTLWVFDRCDLESREITGQMTNPRSVQAAPDGTKLAFIADVSGVAQLCLVALDGSAADVLTDLPQGVAENPAWAPAGDQIAFAARSQPLRDPSVPYRIRRTTFRFEGRGLIDDAVQDIFVIDLDTRTVRQITNDERINEDPRWSPDGSEVLFRASFPPDEEWTAKPAACVIGVNSGDRRTIVDAWGGVITADWCPDGRHIVFTGAPVVSGLADIHWQKHDVWVVDSKGGDPVCRTEAVLPGVGHWLEYDHPTWGSGHRPRIRFDGDGRAAYVSAQRGCDVEILRVDLYGDENVSTTIASTNATYLLQDFDDSNDCFLYIASTFIQPPELILHDGDSVHKVTELNEELLKDIVRPDLISLDITAPDGLEIEGWALTPPGAGPFPTVLAIHGGPSDAYGSVYMIDFHLLVGAGCAVVFSNFRGSGGYGSEFHQALDGRWGEMGEQDHLATVDRAIELGVTDSSRVGLYGLSHGGFATCWLAGRTNRFQAAVAENPGINFVTGYATMDAPWWVPLELGALPSENPELYARCSALTHAPNCTLPMLFIVSEGDLRCHPSEAEQYYRILKANGCVTEMLRMPNANHIGSWTGPVAARAAQNEALVEWFSRYLRVAGE